jgi:hypothetical protein
MSGLQTLIAPCDVKPETTKAKKTFKTEREKSKPIFEKKEKVERKFFIIKPDCESQGNGIYLTDTWEDVEQTERVVAQ